jgi:hypothetical protein
MSQIKKGDLFGAPSNLSSKALISQGNQLSTRSLYSTVVKSSTTCTNIGTKVPNHSDDSNQKGYFLTMVLEITSPNLWMSPYSEHQQTLFGIIQQKHEVEGLNFVQISEWLNENHYLTPRGKVFTQSHAWGIYTKKMRSIKRFSRDNDTQVVSTGIDVINYVVDRT